MKKRLIFVLAIVLVLACALAACNNEFTVTFDLQNGTAPVVVNFDDNFALPQNPTNGNKIFGGWYTDSNCSDGNEWTVPTTLSGNVTVYAKWSEVADLSEVFRQYEDYENWNFKATYVMVDENGDYLYDDVLEFLGVDFSMQYEFDGVTYKDFVVFDVEKDQYVYIEQQEDGTYVTYYEVDDADDFYWAYSYADYVELSTLGDFAFVQNGDRFCAVDAHSVGNEILGGWGDSCTWTSVEIYVVAGKISKIVAVQQDTSEEYAGTYTFTLEFSQYGDVSLDVPDLSGGGNGGGSDGDDEGGQAVVTIDSFSLSGSAYGYYNWNVNGISGLAFIYSGEKTSIQMSAKKTAYYLASTSAAPGGIQSVTVKLAKNTYDFELFTSNTAYGQVNGAPASGTSQGVKTATTSGVTWTLTGTDAYFCLVCKGTGAAYVESVTIVFGNGGGNGGGGVTETMPNQIYDEDTFDNSNLQDQLKRVDGAIGLSSTGTYDCLVVPVQFTNDLFTSAELATLEKAFNGTAEDTGWQSVSSYYKLSSYNNLNMHFDVQAPFTAANSYNSYTSAETLLTEVMSYLANTELDLSRYDHDQDGVLDAVYIIYSAPIDYVSDDSTWWAYVTWYQGNQTYGGLELYYYLFAGYDFVSESVKGGYVNEYYPEIAGLKINASTFIHETGHLLGLDDYYDYETRKGCNEGLGGADMMDGTVGDHDAYSKTMLGWVTPTIVTTTQTVTIGSFQSSGECILIPLNFNNSYFCEYLLIDLYTNDGLNALHAAQDSSYLYGGANGEVGAEFGARIYFVSSAISANPFEDDYGALTANNNSTTNVPLIKLVEADGENNYNGSQGWAMDYDLWQTGDALLTAFPNYSRSDGKLVNFDVSFDSVTATSLTVTITFATAA